MSINGDNYIPVQAHPSSHILRNELDLKHGAENGDEDHSGLCARTEAAARNIFIADPPAPLPNPAQPPIILSPAQPHPVAVPNNQPIVLNPVNPAAAPNIALNPVPTVNLTPVNGVRPFSQAVITDANQLFLDARNARNDELRSSLKKWIITGLVICGIAAALFFTGGAALAPFVLAAGLFIGLVPSSIRYGLHLEGDCEKLNAAEFEEFCMREYERLVTENPTNTIPLFESYFREPHNPNYFMHKESPVYGMGGLSEDSFEKFCQDLYAQAAPNQDHLVLIKKMEYTINAERNWKFNRKYTELTPESRETRQIAKNPERLEFKEMCEAREDANSGYTDYVTALWNAYVPNAEATPKKDRISDVYKRFRNVATSDDASKDLRLYRLFKEQKKLDTLRNGPHPDLAAIQREQDTLHAKQDDLFAYYGRTLIAPRAPAAPPVAP